VSDAPGCLLMRGHALPPTDVGDIVRHVASAGLAVSKCDRHGVTRSAQVSEVAISEMLEESRELWGALLPYYLWVSSSHRARAVTLAVSIAEIQAAALADAFLLVGYEDEGVVSVSNSKLSFQAGVQPADWWQP
jgi:hypothetical protein